MSLTLAQLVAANLSRVKRWHPGGLSDWSALEWAGAMAGEAGEACNVAKKLKRVEDQIANINHEDGRSLTDRETACQQVGKEVADTIIYGILLASRVGVDIEQLIVEVFNAKSEEYGFPERLPVLLDSARQLAQVTQDRDELLSALNSFSPDLLNTPKRNSEGTSTLTVQQQIAIAWREIEGWMHDYEEATQRAEHAEAERDDLLRQIDGMNTTINELTNWWQRAEHAEARAIGLDERLGALMQQKDAVSRDAADERRWRLSLKQTLDDWQKQIRRLQAENEFMKQDGDVLAERRRAEHAEAQRDQLLNDAAMCAAHRSVLDLARAKEHAEAQWAATRERLTQQIKDWQDDAAKMRQEAETAKTEGQRIRLNESAEICEACADDLYELLTAPPPTEPTRRDWFDPAVNTTEPPTPTLRDKNP